MDGNASRCKCPYQKCRKIRDRKNIVEGMCMIYRYERKLGHWHFRKEAYTFDLAYVCGSTFISTTVATLRRVAIRMNGSLLTIFLTHKCEHCSIRSIQMVIKRDETSTECPLNTIETSQNSQHKIYFMLRLF